MGRRLVVAIYPDPRRIEATHPFGHLRDAQNSKDFSGEPGDNNRGPSLGSLSIRDNAVDDGCPIK